MKWLKSLFSMGASSKTKKHTTRLGKTVEVDDAFEAWSSGELRQMLKAAKTKTNPIDRHFLLMSIVTEAYKYRKEAKSKEICIEYSEKHLNELPRIIPSLKKDMGGTLPRISTFQHYATLLAEIGEHEKAISVCEQAISYGLHDNTKSGYQGRIERIKKQAAKNA